MVRPRVIKCPSKLFQWLSSTNTYLWTALVLNAIRLLDLRPRTSSEGIQCGVFLARLTDQPKYYALSYIGGDPEEFDLIKLNHKHFMVRKSM